MNDDTAHLDQTDEDILTCTVSDEALEATGGTEVGTWPATLPWYICGRSTATNCLWHTC